MKDMAIILQVLKKFLDFLNLDPNRFLYLVRPPCPLRGFLYLSDRTAQYAFFNEFNPIQKGHFGGIPRAIGRTSSGRPMSMLIRGSSKMEMLRMGN